MNPFCKNIINILKVDKFSSGCKLWCGATPKKYCDVKINIIIKYEIIK